VTATHPDRTEAYEAFYRRHVSAVRAYARRRVGPEDAEDVTAQTFLIAWRRWDAASDGQLPWLLRTAALNLRNLVRTETRRDRLVQYLGGVAEGNEPQDHATAIPTRVVVAAALLTLSPDDREILLLSAWEDLSVRDIARTLDCSLSAASVRLYRARRRLRRAMDDDGDRSLRSEKV
jgi:RNA polymerase sigma-70 factor (ECF subfamily)